MIQKVESGEDMTKEDNNKGTRLEEEEEEDCVKDASEKGGGDSAVGNQEDKIDDVTPVLTATKERKKVGSRTKWEIVNTMKWINELYHNKTSFTQEMYRGI